MRKCLLWLPLLVAAMSLPAVAQGTAPNPAAADLESALNALVVAAGGGNTQALEAAVADNAVLAINYYGLSYMTRADFIRFVGYQSISEVEFADRRVTAAGGLGFATATIRVPGFVDGFFYSIWSKETGKWQLVYAAVDPTANMVSKARRDRVKALAEQFGLEMATAAAAGSLEPVISRIDKDRAVALFGMGGFALRAEGHDDVVQQLRTAEQFMGAAPGGIAGFSFPKEGETPAFDTGLLMSDVMCVMWANPEIQSPTGEGKASMYSVLVGVVRNDALRIVALAAGIDAEIPAGVVPAAEGPDAAGEPSAEVVWAESLDEALKRSADEGKPVYVHFGAEWCHWCKKLEEECYVDADCIAALANFVPVRVDTDNSPDLAKKYEVGGIPQILFLDAEGNVVYRPSAGYRPPADFVKLLQEALAEISGEG